MPEAYQHKDKKVQDALKSAGIEAKVVELPDSTRTAVEAAQAIGTTVAQIVKSLVFRGQTSGNAILIRANQFARLTELDGGADSGADLQGLTVYLSTARGEPVALAEVAQGELRPFRVFNFGSAP